MSDTIKCALMKSTYTPNASTDQFWGDISSNVIGTPLALTSKSSTNGVSNAADAIFPTVASGNTVGSIVVYKDTGNSATSPLIVYFDTGTGLPYTTDGTDITVVFTGNNIYSL